MDEIQHHFASVQGLKLHVAQLGAGPKVVLLLHGFPEIWYSWRHQIVALASAGFRAIAPDYRGYGLSDQPPEPEKTSYADLINDLVAILDHFGINKVYVVAKDFGGKPAHLLALKHPDRVAGIVTLGAPHVPPRPPQWLNLLPEGFYIRRWGIPGRAEADFGRFDAKTVVRNVYILFSGSEIPIAAENQEVMDLVDASTPLPQWFSEKNLSEYGALYEKSGFRTALKLPYRSFDEDFGLEDPTVRLPALLIMGCKDFSLKFPGMEEYLKNGAVKELVPDLEIVYISEGTHFVQEQFPDMHYSPGTAFCWDSVFSSASSSSAPAPSPPGTSLPQMQTDTTSTALLILTCARHLLVVSTQTSVSRSCFSAYQLWHEKNRLHNVLCGE